MISNQQSQVEKDQSHPLMGKYLGLEELCTCTQTYQKYANQIDPYPRNQVGAIRALQALCQHIVDPVIEHFGKSQFNLTYGFCSIDLKRYLNQKDPQTGIKNGRVDPTRDQHMSYEKNQNGKYYCDLLGAACDFRIVDLESDLLVNWILEQQLRFDSLYYYGS